MHRKLSIEFLEPRILLSATPEGGDEFPITVDIGPQISTPSAAPETVQSVNETARNDESVVYGPLRPTFLGNARMIWQLSPPDNVDPESYGIQITNHGAATAHFEMQLNGNLGRNITVILRQIRQWPTPLDNPPDYMRAYYFMLDMHTHDYSLTGQFWIHDPVLYVNSLGFGLCDDAASALVLIWREMGYDARVWLLNRHVVPEVYTGTRWEMYDPDLRVFYYNPSGDVAGVEELAASPHLVRSPLHPVSDNPYVYSARMASFFYTTDNNSICDVCIQDVEHTWRDLYFQLPPGAQMTLGPAFSCRKLSTIVGRSPSVSPRLKITIPSGTRATLEMPLVLFDIDGSAGDFVELDGERFALGSDHIFTALMSDSPAPRVRSIHIDNNAKPIHLLYLVNERIAQILSTNTVEILPAGGYEGNVNVELVPLSRTWRFVDGEEDMADDPVLVGQPIQSSAGLRLNGKDQYVDGSTEPVASIFQGGTSFSVAAWLKLDADDATRRPIVDSYRFALEVESSGTPHAYFRQQGGGWRAVRGQPLVADQWYDLQATYDHGELSLYMNGQLQAVKHGLPMDDDYPLRGPYIGHSDHLGGMFFEGTIYTISLSAALDSTASSSFLGAPV
ncbi:MAG: hypothetical protein JW829_03080 [Pirellulales bacterium]|nr:hypothetical protein [Pirellulales bacterium]